MSTLPHGKDARIAWLEERMIKWGTSYAQIGLASAQVVSLTALVDDCRAKYAAAHQARTDSKGKTIDLDNAWNSMSAMAGDLIKTVRIYAESTNDPEVYGLANIPPPAVPAPAGPPPQPTAVSHHCNDNGSVTLRWKGSTAQGAFFNVYRQLGLSGPFARMTVTASKDYIDNTLPAGTIQATYYIVGQRGNDLSPQSANYVVKLGVQTEGGETGLSLAA